MSTLAAPHPQTAADSRFRLTFTERIGYASGDLACSMYWAVFAQFLMFFYTDVVGLGVASVATMFAVTRLWDTMFDPVMGLIADRTRSRHGRYRPWLLWTIVPMVASGILTFTVPDVSTGAKLVYVYVTYTLVCMVYSALNLPYAALMGVMTPDTQERTVLSSFRYVGSFSGNLVVQFSLLSLVAWFGRGNDQFGYPCAIALYGALAAALLVFTFWSTRERVQAPVDAPSGTIWSDMRNLGRNRPWVVLALVVAITLIWISIRSAVTIYYFKYYIGNQALVSSFLGLGTIGAVTGIVCTKWFVRIAGDKRRAFIGVNIIAGLSALCMYFLGPNDIVAIFCLAFVGAFLCGPLMPLMFAMFADTADYGEWKFGRRTTGLIFAAGTASLKLGWAVGSALGGWLLYYYGYHANVVQNAEMLTGFRALMSWIPALFAGVGAIMVFFYSIDSKTEQAMGADLAARRAGNPALAGGAREGLGT